MPLQEQLTIDALYASLTDDKLMSLRREILPINKKLEVGETGWGNGWVGGGEGKIKGVQALLSLHFKY